MTMLTLAGEDADFAEARRLMVLGQITPNAVSDPLLVQAMGEVPRERFVPPGMRHRAYADAPVPLGGERAMMNPMVLGRLLQALAPQPGERALVLGAGTGYGAAVLGRMGLDVTAIESDARLVELGRVALEVMRHEDEPNLKHANPIHGWPRGAPFRLILIEGSVARVPAEIWTQLSEGGRAATVVQGDSPIGKATLFRRAGGTVTETVVFDAAAPRLPEFQGAAGFVF